LNLKVPPHLDIIRDMEEKIKLPHDHGEKEKINKIIESMPSDEIIGVVASALGKLSDPTRLRIFWFLCHCEECVINIAAFMDMSSPAVSHHLRILKNSGLIVSKRSGKETYYRAADTELAQTLHHMIEKIGKITCPK
jgi:DNA-binding transcriptional ArsR family regulator